MHEKSHSRVDVRPRRAVYLNEFDLSTTLRTWRVVEVDRTPFSDNTQLYSSLDLDDEQLSKMEMVRPEAAGDECITSTLGLILQMTRMVATMGSDWLNAQHRVEWNKQYIPAAWWITNVFTTISKVCEKEDSPSSNAKVILSVGHFQDVSYRRQFQPFLPKGFILSSFNFRFSIG